MTGNLTSTVEHLIDLFNPAASVTYGAAGGNGSRTAGWPGWADPAAAASRSTPGCIPVKMLEAITACV